MELFEVNALKKLNEKIAFAIGFFDGVHLGHQQVIQQALDHAQEQGVKCVVMTFDTGPKVALGLTENEGYVTPLEAKLKLLEQMGVDGALVIKFDASFLCLSPDSFIQKYLLELNACFVSVGFDFRFGHRGEGDTTLLQTFSPFETKVLAPILSDGAKISTTKIKQCLKAADLAEITQMLGRPFSVAGEVVSGKQLGRTIGFPTANLKLNPTQMLPARGVYATFSYVDEKRYASMTNIGFNPTANRVKQLAVETHLLDFEGDLYGKAVRIEFREKIRDEVQFDGLPALMAQLKKDRDRVAALPV